VYRKKNQINYNNKINRINRGNYLQGEESLHPKYNNNNNNNNNKKEKKILYFLKPVL